MQGFVEAFSGVSLELNGVCGRGGEPPQRGNQESCSGEAHFEESDPVSCEMRGELAGLKRNGGD